MGSLVGAVLGGFVIGFLVTMLQAYLPDGLRVFRDAFAFAAVIVVLVIRPSGLIPARNVVERA
jgi:branched-chain amino acid transport system permease protein